MPVIFSHSKFMNFTVLTAAHQADIVALWYWIAVECGGPPVSQPVARQWPQADWLD